MADLKFTLKDCDEVLKQCLQVDIKTADLEIIPRKANYIFVITPEKPKLTTYLFAKTEAKEPRIDRIFEDFAELEQFNSKITPKFYCGKSELLFFEDLTCQKFQNNPQTFDIKHIEQVLKVLAGFHAAGFAYEKIKNRTLKEEYGLTEKNFDVQEVEDLLWSVLDDKERIDEVKDKLEERQKRSKFAKTLCHSNLLSQNILFHYNHGTPNDCRLINFKATLYAPPVYDVLQTIFFNTNEDLRKNHWDDLLSSYYGRLTEELKEYDLSIDKIVNQNDFKLSCDDLLPLVKIEDAAIKKNTYTQEIKEILTFPSVTREDCYSIVKNANQMYDYHFLEYIINEKSLVIKIRHLDEEKTINCLLKYNPKDNEIFIYGTLLPQLHQLSINNIDDCLPLCHLQKPQILIFENLDNFHPSFDSWDLNLLSLVAKKIAKLHAGSLILEEKFSDKLKITYRITDEHVLLEQPVFKNEDLEIICELLRSLTAITTSNDDLKKLFTETTKPSKRFRNVISHGFLSRNNVLIQFHNDLPIDCRFVNCQLRFCPPAHDVLSLLRLTAEAVDEESLGKTYYHELAKILASYNCNVEKIVSYNEFVDSLDYCRPLVIIQNVLRKVKKDSIFKSKEMWEKLVSKEDIVELCKLCNGLPNFETYG